MLLAQLTTFLCSHSVFSLPSITFTSPNVIIRNGETIQFSWSSVNFSSQSVGNLHFTGTNTNISLSNNLLLSVASFSWDVPANIKMTYGYKLEFIIYGTSFYSSRMIVAPSGITFYNWQILL
jgi:hypothetical protein